MIIDYSGVSKSTAAGNNPSLIQRVRSFFVQQQRSYQLRQRWHIHLDFFWFPWLFFSPSSLPTTNKDNKQALTCHLGGCVGQPPIQMFFVFFCFPTGGSKEKRCGSISCGRPFLYVSHTMVCLSVEGRPSGHVGWQGKCLCTCSPKQWMASGDCRKWHTHINLCSTLRLIT